MTTSGSITAYQIPDGVGSLGNNPGSITAGPDGALWFTELYGNKIGRLTTSGSLTAYPIPTPDNAPGTIITVPDGALWFVEGSGEIGRISDPYVTAAGSVHRLQ